MKRPGEDRTGLYVLIALMVGGGFALDVATHVGLEVWVLYFIPLIVSLFTTRPIAPVAIGVMCASLVVAGYVLSPAAPVEGVAQISQVNRALGSVALIGLGFVGRQLIATKVRLAVQDWVNEGRVLLSERMRGERNVHDLGRSVLSTLAEYVGAQVGSIYVANKGGNLMRASGYGLDAPLDGKANFVAPGQTLVGQVAANASILVVYDVPDGYIDVRSGTGAAKPRALVLAPTDADGAVNGVIELGFFTPPSAAMNALLTSAAAPVGIAIRSAQYRERLADLLEEAQRQAEELEVQQRELKITNEELEERGHALKQSHVELEETNRQLEEQARALEMQKDQLSSAQGVLRKKAAEVERASRYKSEFLANMSHELRTPLNSALILAKLLIDNKQGNLTREQIQFATNIYTAGNDLLTLINDILDLSKIEAGKLDLTFESVDLARLFAASKQRFEPLAREKKLELVVTIDPGGPVRMESDSVRLKQVITNLLSNAVKFTEQGSVTLRGSAGPRGDVLISVEDTGVGIPADQHHLIFEAFKQADGTPNRKYGGTGLGLSICRELVDLLGGEIRVKSAPGEGSTFTVLLPSRPNQSEPTRGTTGTGAEKPNGHQRADVSLAPVEDDRAALTPGSRVVLVVEDDRVFATILRDLAHELRFQCVIAGSAGEALELVRHLKPAAIILDMGLPDHSGLTVLDLVKRDASARHIPIHVVSVHDYQQVAREMGAVGYALKPVKREQLVVAFDRFEEQIARKARSVLVVEDDATQREAITKLLGNDGVAITSAPNAEEALAKLDGETFDCVVLDLMLPGTSGFELLDQMAKSDKPSLPPVIVYTARGLSLEEEQRLRRHARSIIIKGARSPERLLEEVTLFLHQVAADLPEDKLRMLREALDRETVFTGRRILIVEDDIRNIFALTSALEPKGAIIDVARNGKEALCRIEAERPDIVLMDIMMPEMDGLTATREIRKRGRSSSLPIIALTAKAMPDDRQQCLDAGANDYIAKPIDVEKLVSLCRVWMPR